MKNGNGKINILLVDDNLANLSSLEAILQAPDRNMVRASSGNEALRFLLNKDAAVILLDVCMPEMDGVETAALIRGRERTQDIPIIFMTAYDSADKTHITRSYALGAVDYIIKPIDPEALKSKVAVFVELYRKNEQIRQLYAALRRHTAALEQEIVDRKEAETEREQLLARERAARAEAEHSAESIRRLQAVTDSALARLTLDDLLREMLARIRELLATDSATILLLTEDGQALTVHATIGLEDTMTGLRVPFGQGVAGSIAASRAPLVVEDLSTVEVINPALRRTSHSLIGAPLIVEGRLIGVIHAGTTRLRRFTEDDVRLLRLGADRVALAIEHARLYEVERQARRQAEEANRMKDEFLALVSHELRSPLNAILGYAALLRYGGLDAQKVKHAAEVIERSGKAQTQLIDDLLDTARIISGKLRLELGPVDLGLVIEQALHTIRPAADAKGASLETDFPSEIVQITGDPARLQQVVWNLLSNAVKFTPAGGHVKIRLERVDPHIRITVSDTGKGISPDFLPYVFDRFRQADVSSARRQGGLGLGLSLVKYLVELHGGTVEAASAGECQGATFKVTLPVRAVATPLGEAGDAPITVKSSGKLAGVRALVVDDENDARELIETVFTKYGAEVVAVSSAAEAYSLITATPPQEPPDVIVTDIGMPDEDGYSLMRRVREWERGRGAHLPAVALTAYGRIEDRVRALNAGFQMHVAKPVDPAELAAVIASLIRRPNGDEKT
ncbi:MAG: response regulator [Chloracidobacterium sp.]|nr:response regulator [Chloracidobacterium sp.]